MDAKKRPFKKGMIILWSGLIADIPGGFALCNGANGTPNLQNRFVIGAGSVYAVGDMGGSSDHVHTGTTDGHTHTLESGTNVSGGTPHANYTNTETDTFTTASASSLPPYYALAYIMKL